MRVPAGLRLPSRFELPFEFKGDLVMTAVLDGVPCDRCVLDTGAAFAVIVTGKQTKLPFQSIDENHVRVDSFCVGDVDAGPINAWVKRREFKGPEDLEVYLGTEHLKPFCLTLDYQRSVVVFDRQSFADSTGGDSSAIEFSRGRPTIRVECQGRSLLCILDTGSNANWLFQKAQDKDLLDAGAVSADAPGIRVGPDTEEVAKKRSVVFRDIAVGGLTHSEMRFLLADPKDFIGIDTPEDGIIGTGHILATHGGLQILDFISMKYLLR